ncbi:MAG: hypothetical protein H6732_16330 [Alphaproteobacteria bacterium]|nr:hypothetical protein [Alphaproteobacteria bacterium]
MRLSTETRLGLGGLLALQLLTALAAIGLLVRVSSAVERILEENVATVAAVEEMLGALATQDGDRATVRFDDALVRAEANVTEPEERPLLQAIRASKDRALAGDAEARATVARDLEALSLVNRSAMQRQDDRAQRLGRAGAWAAVLAGLLGFALSVRAYRQIRDRLVGPFLEVDATLSAWRAGDPHRRCLPLEGPLEVRRVAQHLNQILDRHDEDRARHTTPAHTERPALLALLDRQDHAIVVVGRAGEVVAANTRAHALEGPESAGVIAAAVAGGKEVPGWHVTEVDRGWLAERGAVVEEED